MLKINDLMLGEEATMEDVYRAVEWLNDHGYECEATGNCGLINYGIDEDDMIPDDVWKQMLSEI